MATELEAALTVLGLEEYLVRFQDSGFTDWEALSKIAETQLSNLDVRLGHRRRLQRAIARGRLWPENTPLPLGPDLNQRIRDWLYDDPHAQNTEDWEDFSDSNMKSNMNTISNMNMNTNLGQQTNKEMQGAVLDQGYGSQTSSEESGKGNVKSGVMVLSERRTVYTASSELSTTPQKKPGSAGRGVT